MALKSTIHKVRLSLANMNLHHYEDFALTIAKHPSENDLRMMIRLLAYCLSAQEDLQFTKGLSSDSEPDIWKIGYDGSIEHWIELGIPDERRIRQACSKAQRVSLYTYHGQQAQQWFKSIENKIQRFSHLTITHFIISNEDQLIALADKGMNLTVTIEDEEIWISNESERLCVEFKKVKS